MSAPVRVVALDLGEALPDLDTGGGRYRYGRVFAFAGDVPVGEVRLELPATAAQVAQALRAAGLDPPAVLDPPADLHPPVAAVREDQAELPLVSVVVATDLARPKALDRCLAALVRQDHPRYEVVVVANGPRARRAEPPTLPPMVRLVGQPRPGVSAARNRGVAESAGEIVAFTDDDAAPAPGWLRAIAGRFAAEPDAAAVTGLVLPGELETPAQVWFEDSGNAFRQRYRPASFAGGPHVVRDRLADDPSAPHAIYAMGPFGTGCNLAVRRGVLQRLGGFDRALGPGTPTRAGEDLLLLLRLLAGGGRLAYEPSAVVWHWHRDQARQLRQQVSGFGRGFTAMLTAAVLDDPRHLPALIRTRRLRANAETAVSRTVTALDAPPAWLTRARRAGELTGPIAYLAARLRMLWWR